MKKVITAMIAMAFLGYGNMSMAMTVCWFKSEVGIHCCKHVPGKTECFKPEVPELETDVPPPPAE